MATIQQDEEDQTGTTTGSGAANSGQVTTTGGAPDSSSDTTAGSTPSTPSSPTGTDNQAPSAAQPSQQPDLGTVSQLNQGFDWNPLMDYVGGQGTKARGDIGSANQTFQSGLGNFGSFGQQEQQTLQNVLQGSQPLDTGKALLNQKYTGPMAADRSIYDPSVQAYNQSANWLQNTAGINTLLGQYNPALSYGDRAYDALLASQNQDYMGRARGVLADANEVTGLGDQTYTGSQAQSAQRLKDVSAFNDAARGYVTGQRDNINTAIQNQITAGQQRGQATTDALNALKGGTKNFADYDKGMFGFDPAQYGMQNINLDNSKYIVPAGTQTPGMTWANQMMSSQGFPGGYMEAPTTALMAPNTFSQQIDPRQFLDYATPGALTRNTAATAAQGSQYNIAEQLLGEDDRLNPTAATNPTISLNTAAYQKALADAMAGRDAAASKDQEWMDSWQQGPKPTPSGKGIMYGMPKGGIPVGADGKPLTSDQLAAMNTPAAQLALMQARGPHSMNDIYTLQQQPRSATNPWGYAAQGASGVGYGGFEGGGNDQSGNGMNGEGPGGVNGGMGGMYAAGGLIKTPTGRGMARMNNPLSRMGASGGRKPAPTDPMAALNSSSLLSPMGQTMEAGGPIPNNAGVPGVRDSVPIRADAGEFVTTKPAVDAVGVPNMKALNRLHMMPPAQQAQVRNALHGALSQAMRG